jgi:toxin ParE1/3/4
VPVRPLRVRWLRTALANLEAHAQYIARDNPAAARRVVAAIERSVALVARYLASGRRGRVESTRELVVPGTPYIVPYRVRGHTLQILRVFHATRKWPPTL